jgi:hypothetical protein
MYAVPLLLYWAEYGKNSIVVPMAPLAWPLEDRRLTRHCRDTKP